MYKKLLKNSKINLSDISYIRGYYSNHPITDEEFDSIEIIDTEIPKLDSTKKLDYTSDLVSYLSKDYVGKYFYVKESKKLYRIEATRSVTSNGIDSSIIIPNGKEYQTLSEFLNGDSIEGDFYYIVELNKVYYWIKEIKDLNLVTSIKVEEDLDDETLVSRYSGNTILVKDSITNNYNVKAVAISDKLVTHKTEVTIHNSLIDSDINIGDLISNGSGYKRVNSRYISYFASGSILKFNSELDWGTDEYDQVVQLKYDGSDFIYTNSDGTKGSYGRNYLINDKSKVLFMIAEESQLDATLCSFYDSMSDTPLFTNYDLLHYRDVFANNYPSDIYLESDKYYETNLFDKSSKINILIKSSDNLPSSRVGSRLGYGTKDEFEVVYVIKINNLAERDPSLKSYLTFDGRFSNSRSSYGAIVEDLLSNPQSEIEIPVSEEISNSSNLSSLYVYSSNSETYPVDTVFVYNNSTNRYEFGTSYITIEIQEGIVYYYLYENDTLVDVNIVPDFRVGGFSLTVKDKSGILVSDNKNIIYGGSALVAVVLGKSIKFNKAGHGVYTSIYDGILYTLTCGTDGNLTITFNGNSITGTPNDFQLSFEFDDVIADVKLLKLLGIESSTSKLLTRYSIVNELVDPVINDVSNLPSINKLIIKDSTNKAPARSVTLDQVDGEYKYYNSTGVFLDSSSGSYIYNNKLKNYSASILDSTLSGKYNKLVFEGTSDSIVVDSITDERSPKFFTEINSSTASVNVDDVLPLSSDTNWYSINSSFGIKIGLDGSSIPPANIYSIVSQAPSGNTVKLIDVEYISGNESGWYSKATGAGQMGLNAVWTLNGTTGFYEVSSSSFKIKLGTYQLYHGNTLEAELILEAPGIYSATRTVDGTTIKYIFVFGLQSADKEYDYFQKFPLSTDPWYEELNFYKNYSVTEENTTVVKSVALIGSNVNQILFKYEHPLDEYYKDTDGKIYRYDYLNELNEIHVLYNNVKILDSLDGITEPGYYALVEGDNYHIYQLARVPYEDTTHYYEGSSKIYDSLSDLIDDAEADLTDYFNNKAYKVFNGEMYNYYKISIFYTYHYIMKSINSTIESNVIQSESTDTCSVFHFEYDEDNIFNTYISFILFGPKSDDGTENRLTYFNLDNSLTLIKGNKNSYSQTYANNFILSIDDENNLITESYDGMYPDTIENSTGNYNLLFAVENPDHKMYVEKSSFSLIEQYTVFNKIGDSYIFELDGVEFTLSFDNESSLWTFRCRDYKINATATEPKFVFNYLADIVAISFKPYENYKYYSYGKENVTSHIKSSLMYIGDVLQTGVTGYYAALDFYSIKNCNYIYRIKSIYDQALDSSVMNLVYIIKVDSIADIPNNSSSIVFNSIGNRVISYEIDNEIPELIVKLYTENQYIKLNYTITRLNDLYLDHSLTNMGESHSLSDLKIASIGNIRSILGSNPSFKRFDANRESDSITVNLYQEYINIHGRNPTLVNNRYPEENYCYAGYSYYRDSAFIYAIYPIEVIDNVVTKWYLSGHFKNNSYNFITLVGNIQFNISELTAIQKPIIIHYNDEHIFINLNQTINLINLSNQTAYSNILNDNSVYKFAENSDLYLTAIKFKDNECSYVKYDTSLDSWIKLDEITGSDLTIGELKFNLSLVKRLTENNNYDVQDIYLYDAFAVRVNDYNAYIYSYSPVNSWSRIVIDKPSYIASNGIYLYYVINDICYRMNMSSESNPLSTVEQLNYLINPKVYRSKEFELTRS